MGKFFYSKNLLGIGITTHGLAYLFWVFATVFIRVEIRFPSINLIKARRQLWTTFKGKNF